MARRRRGTSEKPKKRFVFKGSRGGQPKVEWPNRLKAIITVISETDEELTGGDIITAAIDAFNEYNEEEGKKLFMYTNDEDDPILDVDADEYNENYSLLPKSYRNKHASSVIWGQKDRLLQALGDKRNKSHKEACKLADEFELWDLLDEVEIVEPEAKGRPKATVVDITEPTVDADVDDSEPAMAGSDGSTMESDVDGSTDETNDAPFGS